MATNKLTDLVAAGAASGDELVEVSQLSSTVTITAATISALAADNSFNDSANGFVAAGFAVGQRVGVSGFTGDVANNIQIGTITALTTGKMTIGGTDGDVIVDDAAGENVTISKWESRRMTAQEIADLGGGGSAGPAAVETISAADTNLLDTDAGKYLRFTNAAAKTLTVQDDATLALPEDGEWSIRNVGAGDLTLIEDTAVTINPPNGGTLVIPQGGTASLKRVAEDEFDLMGQVVAV
jgi:hypothetical protein